MWRLFDYITERIHAFAKIFALRFLQNDDILYFDTVYISNFAERYLDDGSKL